MEPAAMMSETASLRSLCDSVCGESSGKSCDQAFDQVVVEYWDERACTYSNGIWDELQDAHAQAWREVLIEKLGASVGVEASAIGRAEADQAFGVHVAARTTEAVSAAPANAAMSSDTVGAHTSTGKSMGDLLFASANDLPLAGLKVLDLGCGPGFFEILLSQLGCQVDAVDSSTQMLARACDNVALAGNPERVEFFCGDIAKLPFVSDVYDVVISRNVTWLMRDPVATYAEWRRVLKPGGKLLVFDANWYTYLADEALDRARLCDQVDPSILNWGDRSFASTAQERRCEAIARELPHTYHQRPAWDLETLSRLDFAQVSADKSVYRRVWNAGEQAFYATSPLFAIEAVKVR